jgi:sugar lactone lactonase YvrE
MMPAAVIGLLAFLAWQNFRDYYFRYVGPQAFTAGTGQAVFVRDTNRRLRDEGLAPARFYHLGVHYIYWGYGPNRFLNHATQGSDIANVAEVLPIVDDDSAAAVFMVWPVNQQYLPILEAYYPEGIEEAFHYGHPDLRDPLLVSYRVSRQEIVARRQQLASYQPAVGPRLERREAGLGTLGPPPPGLSYPVDARWYGAFFAPRFGRYRFQLITGSGGDAPVLAIDDLPVVLAEADEVADETVVLARGLHRIELTGKLLNSASKIVVLLATDAGTPQPIPSTLLWSSSGGSLLGEVRGASGPVARRLDGFLGFRDLRAVYPERAPVAATWRGTLKTTAAGRYEFKVYASGRSRVLIDGVPVVELDSHPQARWGSGSLELGPVAHQLMVEYEGVPESGYLELYWRPPGGTEVLLGPSQLEPAAGVWRVGEVEAPELPRQEARHQPGLAATELVRGKGLSYPYALAVTPGGDIVVADARNHRLMRFDASGRKLDTWGEEGDSPGEFGAIEDIAIGADGSIFVLESRPGRIQRLRADGTPDAVVAEGAWCAPNGLDVDERGGLYIAETCGNRILLLDAAGAVARVLTGGADAATRFEQPVDVAVGEAGALFVADLRGRIARVDAASDRILEVWPMHVGAAVAAASVAVSGPLLYLSDPDGHVIYRVDTGTGAVHRVGTQGQGPGEFTTPLGIAVGRQGEVYVGDGETGRVQVFNGLANMSP